MLIKKVVAVAFNVQNCIGLFTDPENIKQIIIDRYEGRCINECYIQQVLRIMRVGECVINQDGSPSFGTMPVIFECLAIIYAPGEIINGCIIQNRDKSTGILICTCGHTNLMVSAHPSFESLVAGQIISVRVVSVRYYISSAKIAIAAVNYVFNFAPRVYKLREIVPKTLEIIENVRLRIEYEETRAEQIKKDNPKAWNTFAQLLAPYNAPQTLPEGATTITINELIALKNTPEMYLCRDPRIDLSAPLLLKYTAAPAEQITELVSANNVLIILLEDYCNHLRTIREMVEIYSTEEILISHRNLWQIFKKLKH